MVLLGVVDGMHTTLRNQWEPCSSADLLLFWYPVRGGRGRLCRLKLQRPGLQPLRLLFLHNRLDSVVQLFHMSERRNQTTYSTVRLLRWISRLSVQWDSGNSNRQLYKCRLLLLHFQFLRLVTLLSHLWWRSANSKLSVPMCTRITIHLQLYWHSHSTNTDLQYPELHWFSTCMYSGLDKLVSLRWLLSYRHTNKNSDLYLL